MSISVDKPRLFDTSTERNWGSSVNLDAEDQPHVKGVHCNIPAASLKKRIKTINRGPSFMTCWRDVEMV